jgi:hypothetical protein
MNIACWAEHYSSRMVSPLGARWTHIAAVAEQARRVSSLLPRHEREILIAAAYLHDIGYAPELAITGFHPLDGARLLRLLGHDRVAGLVAHHTRALHEARLRGLEKALAEFDDEGSLVSGALAYCDLTTGPSGERMTPEQRLLDVEARYGEDNPVTNGLRAAWSELMDAIRQVEELLRQPTRSVVAQPR